MEEIIASHNSPAISVSELSSALKRTIETAFEHVRVRGEISTCKIATSGHIYFDLKDDKALINAVCWKGIAAKLPAIPENGMEVICTGRISTYAGRSNYQLLVEYMELSGAGALAAMLEKRKQQFASEGLFDAGRKRQLPYLPKTIGVVTSPTGAVIRDILHRISERFPVKVLVWGVLVQGRGAEAQIAEAINGFNKMENRPDLLIVARGGGSMEDLWCFNEEIVVRAAAASHIPLISAIGHETDFTLLDFVADRRAPTPTAAAEIAVPVRDELRLQLAEYDRRLQGQIFSQTTRKQERINAVARGLINPNQALEMRLQRLDEWTERLQGAVIQIFERKEKIMQQSCAHLNVRILEQKLQNQYVRLQYLLEKIISNARGCVQNHQTNLSGLARMMEGLSHQSVLQRGYAYLSNAQTGEVIASIKELKQATEVKAHLHDGEIIINKQFRASKKISKTSNDQPSLL
jgi:exodeoxyribonuclease VII large subunit